ncbi:hypothetical protein PPSIR1_26653 [Plesiocystis pacifica SIR-1]|uniref:Lipoprotein n=1 Tax=Plesiocystis pacifica SIR-1 TaxID=391625 RepID=A6GA96_9BACT|nr:hypothetical protein [Plesiocystis pacifica]EDM77198.1 hypothetical protein PPSIR1_26653 [Plesiocystis pacifica SIR-1]
MTTYRLSSSTALALSLACFACTGPGDDEDSGDEQGDTAGDTTETDSGAEDSETDTGTEDSETGADDTTDTGEGNQGSCGEVTVTVLRDLQTAPNTFELGVEAMLASAVGSYAGTFSWYAPDGPYTADAAGTSAGLEFEVRYEGGEVRLVEYALHGELPEGQLGGEPCSNRVEVDAVLDFATDDGLFAEQAVAIELRASALGSQALSFRHELDFEVHAGELAEASFDLGETGELRMVQLGASFQGEGGGAPAVAASGSLAIEVLETELDFVGFGPVASYFGLAEGVEDLCGGCGDGELCQAWGDFGESSCEGLPAVCEAEPNCGCVGGAVCGDALLACVEGEGGTVSMVICAGP